MSFADDFIANREVSDEPTSFAAKKIEFTVLEATLKPDFKLDFWNEPAKEALVFKIKSEDGHEHILAQSTYNQKGEKSENMFWGMTWDDSRGQPRKASLLWELKEAVKGYIGVDQYEERKKDAGGVNAKFFQSAKFYAYVNDGQKKDGTPYYIVKLPLENLLSSWKYLIDKGDYADWADISDVQT